MNGSSPRVRGTLHVRCAVSRLHRFIPACAGNSRSPSRAWATGTVHPRVCGELEKKGVDLPVTVGSSPRVRGTRRLQIALGAPRRFIPACAGNSWGLVADSPEDAGSSPRVRGTPQGRLRRAVRIRFIPACAGNSCCERACGAGWWRFIPACAGNSFLETYGFGSRDGSSPRVRGTPPQREGIPMRRRFIPACAGNSTRSRRSPPTSPVHPRVCGELDRSDRRHRPCRRFIPACAGNSTSSTSPPRSASVHPRVCGELDLARYLDSAVSGSSPRVRGTLTGPNLEMLHQGGSSPRVRGTRKSPETWRKANPVHPRVCGELNLIVCQASLTTGSSPRVRGTRRRQVVPERHHRFIPACAGNSTS